MMGDDVITAILTAYISPGHMQAKASDSGLERLLRRDMRPVANGMNGTIGMIGKV